MERKRWALCHWQHKYKSNRYTQLDFYETLNCGPNSFFALRTTRKWMYIFSALIVQHSNRPISACRILEIPTTVSHSNNGRYMNEDFPPSTSDAWKQTKSLLRSAIIFYQHPTGATNDRKEQHFVMPAYTSIMMYLGSNTPAACIKATRLL